jgi:hypothetical protein
MDSSALHALQKLFDKTYVFELKVNNKVYSKHHGADHGW